MREEAWSFNQPVLLNKTQRNSSVLVWTLVGTTLFAAGWAVLAPLPETVAVQGKLQPSTPIHKIETPLPGVVEAVLVREGERVRQGQELVRFDSVMSRHGSRPPARRKCPPDGHHQSGAPG